MPTKKIYLFLIVILLTGLSERARSQDAIVGDITTDYKSILSFVPQYAFYYGIRFDYERRLTSNGSWLVIAPQLYSDRNGDPYYYGSDYGAYQTLFGFGFNAYYKVQVYKSDKLNRQSAIPRHVLYFSAGPSVQYFKLTNEEEVTTSYVEDGITYYTFSLEEVQKPITRIGGIMNTGWQLTFDRFVFDIYLGVQIKYSLDGDGKIIDDQYWSDWVDPTYTGVMLDGGVKFGFFL